jgi:rubrerythrin
MRNGEKHLNRTGSTLSPDLTAALLAGARQTEPSADGDGEEAARVRKSYAEQAEPIGTIPPPATVAGAVKTLAKALTGKKALLLADKLGERLAFERSGTRLYDALVAKLDSHGSWAGGPTRKDLLEIRAEEHAHFTLVKQSMEAMGADPTAVTPSADVHAVASKGLCAVLTDPRTSLRDGLEAILVAELEDNDCWENLIDLSRALGHEDLAESFTEALTHEREHLRRVRLWLGASLSTEATGKLAEPFLARAEERDRRQLVATTALEEESGRAARRGGRGEQQAARGTTGESRNGSRGRAGSSAAGRAGGKRSSGTKGGQRKRETGRPSQGGNRRASGGSRRSRSSSR